MPKYVDIAGSHRCEEDGEHDEHHAQASELALEQWAYLAESMPINDHVANHNAQDTIEACRCACFDGVGAAEGGEYVAGNGSQDVYDDASDGAKTVLKSREQDDGTSEIAEEVHKIHVKDCRCY